MDATEMVREYGYLAVAVGTFFEGELIMLTAGVAAAAGRMSLPTILMAGMAGVFCSDTFCFFLGRFAGKRLAGWFPKTHARLGGIFQLIEKHDDKLIVFFQFFPGLCTVTPIAFGMTAISTPRFMLLDLLGNVIWTVAFTLGGYLMGHTFESAFGDMQHWLGWALGGVLMMVFGLGWLISRWRSKAA